MEPAQVDVNSLERIVPDHLEAGGTTGSATLEYHLERYSFAARHLRGANVLDMACGVGYGTRFLVERCPQIALAHGVDISSAAISYARVRYGHAHIEYFCEDAIRFGDSQAYDTVVSLETVEHMPKPPEFVSHLAGLLRPGGVLIASVPTTPSMDGNPNHLADFTERSFRKLGSFAGLREIASLSQVQPFDPAAIASHREKRLARTRSELLRFYARRPEKLFARAWATLRYGFANRYLTVAWEKPGGESAAPPQC